jgi:hypothetical protein
MANNWHDVKDGKKRPNHADPLKELATTGKLSPDEGF